jgi:hypothetical protein
LDLLGWVGFDDATVSLAPQRGVKQAAAAEQMYFPSQEGGDCHKSAIVCKNHIGERIKMTETG